MYLRNALLILALASAAFGQTRVDLRTQAKGASAGQLSDLGVTWSATNTLTIGAGCAPGRACNVRFGNTVYSIQNGATATLSSGSGLAFIFVSSAGVLTVGHNLTVACSAGCSSQSGVSGFPVDSIPLFTWSATAGVWDTSGGVDFRAFLSAKNTVSGLGLISTETAGLTTMAIDPTSIGVRVAAPATAASACAAGNWAFDASFFYVCVANNSWKRAGVAAW